MGKIRSKTLYQKEMLCERDIGFVHERFFTYSAQQGQFKVEFPGSYQLPKYNFIDGEIENKVVFLWLIV